MNTWAIIIAGLLIFSIGFALGFFVCILGLIMTRAQQNKEKMKGEPKK